MMFSGLEARLTSYKRANLFEHSLLFCIVLSLWGCAALHYEEPTTPEAAVRAFAVALDSKDYERAYKLMSSAFRNRVAYEEFRRQITENPREVAKMSYELAHIGSSIQSAVVTYGIAEEIYLVRDSGRWKIASNIVAFYDQSTPRAALRSFVRALERRRYDVVMRLIPSNEKEGVTPEKLEQTWSGKGRDELERIVNNLNNHLNDPIERVGKRATMTYGEHLSVEFVLEGKNWKIERPE
jgi:hypothetical protein